MEGERDFYATLRVGPDADDAAIRRAYRKLMRRYHPDVNRRAGAGDHSAAINEAYACLRDPTKRAAYDARRHAPRPPRRPAATPMRRRHWQPTHHLHYAERFDEVTPVQSRRWKAISLGLAALLTLITFTATSAVDTSVLPPAGFIIDADGRLHAIERN